jgi:hypothetical protein
MVRPVENGDRHGKRVRSWTCGTAAESRLRDRRTDRRQIDQQILNADAVRQRHLNRSVVCAKGGPGTGDGVMIVGRGTGITVTDVDTCCCRCRAPFR